MRLPESLNYKCLTRDSTQSVTIHPAPDREITSFSLFSLYYPVLSVVNKKITTIERTE